MEDKISGNRRIAQNTVYLYLRTLVVMLITLYTSRVILQVLGAEDFGIYNVVGGVIVFFTFVSGAMSAATQRFLSYALGRRDEKEYNRVFSVSILTHFLIAFAVLIIAETVGLWFVNTQMNFPTERVYAVLYVYHFSIVGFCFNILRTPYSASIIAQERMSFFAYASIIENLLKLVIVYMLPFIPFDKLIVYSALLTIVIILTNLIYYYFCRRYFVGCEFHYIYDPKLFRSLLGFSGWSMFGSLASIGATQGVNIIFNIFLGVLVNAAMGIASQVHSAVSSFVTNFQTAFVPQIVKSYASGDIRMVLSMIFKTSRLSYYLIFLVGIPVIMFCDDILKIWLGEVPEYTIRFTQLMVVLSLIEAVSGPIWYTVQATGKIKVYQIIMALIMILNLPMTFCFLFYGYSPVVVLWGRVGIHMFTHIIRVVYLKKLIPLSLHHYLKRVLVPIGVVTLLSLTFPVILYGYADGNIAKFFLLIFMEIQTLIVIYIVGLEKTERCMVNSFFKQKIIKR